MLDMLSAAPSFEDSTVRTVIDESDYTPYASISPWLSAYAINVDELESQPVPPMPTDDAVIIQASMFCLIFKLLYFVHRAHFCRLWSGCMGIHLVVLGALLNIPQKVILCIQLLQSV